MELLPSEIIHMLCTRLEPVDVAQLRIARKVFAPIGLQYLLPKVHLLLKPSSFTRLKAISEHPMISRHVSSLYYEADVLCEYDSIDEWKREIQACQLEAMERHEGCIPTDEHLQRAYGKYKKYVAAQAMIRSRTYESEKLKEALIRFPGLKNVVLSTMASIEPWRDAFMRAFQKGMVLSCGDGQQLKRCGVPQLRSLLLAVENAGIHLESLECGYVHLQFFRIHNAAVFEKFQQAVQSLRRMALTIRTCMTSDELLEDYHMYLPEYLASPQPGGRLPSFIGAASHLESLNIGLDHPVPLKIVVGNLTWPKLKSASFSKILVDGDDLIDFYGSHANTLIEVRLHSMTLTAGGSWSLLLWRMRTTLRLKEVTLDGFFETVGSPGQQAYFLCYSFRTALEDYVLAGGEVPMLDLDKLQEEFRAQETPHYAF